MVSEGNSPEVPEVSLQISRNLATSHPTYDHDFWSQGVLVRGDISIVSYLYNLDWDASVDADRMPRRCFVELHRSQKGVVGLTK